MGRVVRLGAVSREETPTAAMRSLILSVVLVGFATPAFAQAVCGGHYITYIGGLPTATPDFRTYIGGPPTATPRIRQHGPPTLSEPSGMTAQDRALWDALIFDAYEHPTPSPDAEDYWRSSIPLEERHTRVMDTGDATSFGLCIQEADESYTGERLEQYDSAWWRGEVQRFTNGRWTGTLEVGTCTGDPPAGWVYVREGDPGEVDDDSIAHAVTWYSRNIHGTVETWVKSEIVFHSERKVRNTSEAYFKVTLAHELGHVLGLSHVPPSSSFVMAPGTLSTWPDQESRLAQLAHQVGAGFEYPGFGPANTPATGAPTITGTARVDETLTAVTTGIMDADGLASPSYTYQWIRVETDSTEADISGATSGTYTLAAADEGKTIKVKVSFTDDASNPEMRTSAATGTVAAANTPATGAPTITGTAQVDETLTAVTTGIMDADGLASPTYTYQWIRVDGGTDADISGATSSTYTLVAADEGKTIKVKVSFTDDDSNPEMRTSAATATVAAATTPTISAVAVTSTPQLETDTYGEGEDIQFTVTFSEAVKVTGMPRFVFSLGNSGDGRQVNAGYDAAASTDTALVFAYTVVSTDKDNNGIYILDDVTVSGTAGSGSIVLDTGQSIVGKTSEVPASLAHSVRGAQSGHKVDGSPNSPATGAPTITGTAQVDETLTAATTGIMDADGVTSPSYTYQWIRVDGGTDADISGATSSTYTLVAADEGKTIKVKVSFTDDASNPETRTSAATATVAAATTPTISAVAVTSTPQLETDTYGEGEDIQFTVTFSEAVKVTGMPRFVFSLGNSGDGRQVNAGYDAAASTDTALVFAYTVVSTDKDNNGIYILDDVTVSGTAGSGSIVLDTGQSIVGKTSEVPASLAHSVRGGRSGHKVDGSPNSPATGAPTITGTAKVGETLTAVTTGIMDADGVTSVSYTYQWIRVETDSTEADISGATSGTYTLVAADEGKTIKVKVSFTDDASNPEMRTSAATATVVAAMATNTPATGAPTITGTAQVDETLTAATTGIMDADGLASPSYTYQWIRVDGGTDADISGATSSTYTLVAADEGKTIKVKVSFTDDASNPETRTSAATATVAAANSPATGVPTIRGTATITGTAQVGETLTAVTTSIMDADGLTSPTYTYQWIRVDGGTDADISGATSSAYTLVAADEGRTIKVKVSFTDDASNPEMRTSAATATVVAAMATNTPATGAPTITGTAQVGETLTAVTTGIMDADGLASPSYTYQWIRVDGGTDADISGATSSTYTLVAADEGKTIKVKVSFTDDASNPEMRTSAATATVVAKNTPATGAPTITGTARVDETLTAVTTGIMDADGLASPTYTYQWIRVDGGTDADISGATSSAYTLVAADEGTTIKVKVSFTDDATNTETRTSVATGTVAAAANNPATGAPTITGTAQVDETLTAVTTGIMDETEGLDNVSYMYQWIRVDGTDADIAGATSSTYTLVAADEGTTIKVRVSFEDDDGNPETLTSAETAVVTAAAPAAARSVAEDRAALVALYHATGGSSWTSNTHWLSDEALSRWYGVITDENGRVTELSLVKNMLRGEIPVELGTLTNLQRLDLWDNELSGEIPAELGSLTRLRLLYLQGNMLSGPLPLTLSALTQLQLLDIGSTGSTTLCAPREFRAWLETIIFYGAFCLADQEPDPAPGPSPTPEPEPEPEPTPAPENVPPSVEITGLPAEVEGGERNTLRAVVTDPDEDETFTYEWVSDPAVGRFQDATVGITNWWAPEATEEPQDVTITVTVSDGEASATASVVTTVRPLGPEEPAEPEPVPTLPETAAVCLALMMLGVGAIRLRRTRA